MVSTKKSRPLGEIGRCASISYGGYYLYARLETIIELKRMLTIKPEPGFPGSGFYFVQTVGRLVTGDRKRAGSGDEIAATRELS